jgi:hypothetical protein
LNSRKKWQENKAYQHGKKTTKSGKNALNKTPKFQGKCNTYNSHILTLFKGFLGSAPM